MQMSQLRSFWLPFLLFSILIGTAIRLVQIGEPYLLDFHAWRQADTGAFTHGYLTETLNPFDPSLDRFPCEHRDAPFGRAETEWPLIPWLSALPLALLGIDYPPAPYLRAISLLAYIGTCVYLFLLSRQLTESKATAAIAVFIFSVLPLSIFFTRTPQPDGPALLFTCAFLFHLERWLQNDKTSDGALSAVFGALVFLIKISNAFLFFPAIYLIVRRHGWLGSLKRGRHWIWGIAILIPVVGWYAAASRHPWTFGIWQDKYSTWAMFTDPKIWRVFSERITFEILTWSGLVLLVAGLARHGRTHAGRCASVWLCAIFLFVAITLPANQTHIYYQLPLVLPASLMIALAVRSLAEDGWVGRVVLAGALVVHGWLSWNVLQGYWRQDPGLTETAEMLRRHVKPGEIIVSTSRDPRLFYNGRVKGLFLHTSNVTALEACMGPNVRFLLLENGIQAAINKNPALRARLNKPMRRVDVSPGFALWSKR
jgi:4-amino-4-deoxy-L-arabinose transferase-like glycosyltransferase